jgi:hypothetical protein
LTAITAVTTTIATITASGTSGVMLNEGSGGSVGTEACVDVVEVPEEGVPEVGVPEDTVPVIIEVIEPEITVVVCVVEITVSQNCAFICG